MRTIQAATLLAAVVLAGDGQGPVSPGPVTVDDLNLGTYWYGNQIAKEDLRGKVVLFEVWGS
ncbi:MAG: hypothetical protein ACYTGN_17265 [Planctomycetota bacterium]|jgi:hypothetical protein